MHRRDALRALLTFAAGVARPRTLARFGGAALPQLAALAAGSASALTPSRAAANADAFDFAQLKGRARALAAAPYQPRVRPFPDALRHLDWDHYQAIRFRDRRALWAGDGLRFQVKFFHPGWHYDKPVRIDELVDGRAREIALDAGMFDYTRSALTGAWLQSHLGFAGFRVLFHTDPQRDVAAFLGASYFRAVAGNGQYGLSARGLAVDCGLARPEEFPVFSEFWLERPKPDADTLTLYALLESKNVSGAYRFDLQPGPTLSMNVSAALYPRAPIERLGIAPLTSMFFQGDSDRRADADWRPQIHDSDGLAMWSGNGEWIWRPLANPPSLRFSAYQDQTPRGFGLLQRDRNFDHYQDDTAFYDRRPSAWVEPRSNWGKGSIDLVELPAEDETVDNIVAFWNPADTPQPGQELLFDYRLYWGTTTPFRPGLAEVVATRDGIGGVVGQKRSHFSWRFVIDFAGGNLPLIGKDVKVEPVITASRGKVEIASARPLASTGGYRAMFDVRPPEGDTAPVDLRLFLRVDGQPLTETWLYQWSPREERRSA
ncbi:MAG TPA: glucan biosynthesis protein D [Casimicrobiaceae bacterium]|nr:glucan biosynthesis protein D [Casimicrobiaceae bacterium]